MIKTMILKKQKTEYYLFNLIIFILLMGQTNTKHNSSSVFGYGFVINVDFDLEKFDQIKRCVNNFNTINTQYNYHISIWENSSQFFQYETDKIFICIPFITSYNQEIVQGQELMTNNSVYIGVNDQIRSGLTLIGDSLIKSNIISSYTLEWRLFECVKN